MACAAVNGANHPIIQRRRVADARQNTQFYERCQKGVFLVLFGRVINDAHQAAPDGYQFAQLDWIRAANGRLYCAPFLAWLMNRPRGECRESPLPTRVPAVLRWPRCAVSA